MLHCGSAVCPVLTAHVEQSFHGPICISSLVKCLLKSFAHLKLVFSYYGVVRALSVFWIKVLYWVYDLGISPILWLDFSPFKMVPRGCHMK